MVHEASTFEDEDLFSQILKSLHFLHTTCVSFFRAPACVEGMTRMPFAAVVAWQVLQGRHHLCQPCAGAWRSCVSLPRMRV